MTPQEFNEGLIRVEGLLQAKCGDVLKAELLRKFDRTHSDLWFRTIELIVTTRISKGFPPLPEWYDYFRRTKESFGMSTESWKCPRCGSDKMIREPSMLIGDKFFDRVSPCPNCNSKAKVESTEREREATTDAIDIGMPEALEPTEGTIKCVEKNWFFDRLTGESPKDFMARFMGDWKAGVLKYRPKVSAFAKVLQTLTPVVEQQPSTLVQSSETDTVPQDEGEEQEL